MGLLKKALNRAERRRHTVDYWRKRGAVIGTDCEIYPDAELGSEPYLITVGDRVRLNSGVRLITHDGGVWVLRGLYPELADADLFGPVRIGSNVHVGTGAMIMPGVTIGDNCVIGAGAIVTHDVPAGSVAVGIPARVIETVEEYAAKHSGDIEHTKGLSPAGKREYLLKKYK